MSRQAILNKLSNEKPLIAPSMLKCDFGNLSREIQLLEQAGAQILQWDVMDGHFVPNLSYGPMVIERIRALTSLPFDAHLMISDPERYLDDFLKAGCDCITFHVEAVSEPVSLLRRIRESGAVSGLALNPGTPIDAVKEALPECDLVLVMSVNPGFGGQKFISSTLDKLRQLKQIGDSQFLLSVDGGIDQFTIGDTAQAGADIFVVGSAIFGSSDYCRALEGLRAAAQSRIVSS